MKIPESTMPIVDALSLGSDIVAYVVPRSAARPESSDCAGLIARSPISFRQKKEEVLIYLFLWVIL